MTGDLHRLLAAQGISALGANVTAVALPTVAVVHLGAGPVAASGLFVAAYLPGALTGALAGALAYPRLARRHAPIDLCLWASALSAGALFLIPLASLGFGLAVLICYELVFASAVTVWGIANVTLRQLRAPEGMLGRVNALHRTVSLATVPLGAGFAAAATGVAGLSPTMLVLCAFSAMTPFWYLTRCAAPQPEHSPEAR